MVTVVQEGGDMEERLSGRKKRWKWEGEPRRALGKREEINRDVLGTAGPRGGTLAVAKWLEALQACPKALTNR